MQRLQDNPEILEYSNRQALQKIASNITDIVIFSCAVCSDCRYNNIRNDFRKILFLKIEYSEWRVGI